MPRYFLEISFDGTTFKGWQNQPRDPSVQAEVERAIATALRVKEIDVVGCGRTDSGVHARQFFLHFDADDTDLGERFVRNLNGILPDSIGVKRVIKVKKDAHARFDATARTYTYHVHRVKDPFLFMRSYHFHMPLDVPAMNRACKVLIGRKDFSAFQKTGSDNKTKVCDVRVAKWRRTANGCMFTITADRFLRNMVRAIVGTSLRVGTGKEPDSHMRSVLSAKNRSAAGKSAPANGLYLERVEYPYVKA
jgi:tRNA pseudouridine38-40 synthase